MSRDGIEPLKDPIQINPHFAVTGALAPEDYAKAAALGFKSIVSNLPDGESSAHPTAAQAADLAARVGLAYRHIPVTKQDLLSDRVLDGTAEALEELPSPVLAHCASGLRSAAAWALTAARSQPVDCVLDRVAQAGFNLEGLREELDDQHDPGHVSPIPAALDAQCAKDVEDEDD
jgi:sulfide:quinone oxidoreductase